MKSTIFILPALAAGALASHVQLYNNNNHHLNELLGRAEDPKTMNPTQLSVLSVLRTAMPTGPDAAMPTGSVEPAWYQNLPEDVKSLLPVLYPVTAATTTTTTTTTTSTFTATATTHVSVSASQTAAPAAAASPATSSLLLLASPAALVTPALATADAVNLTSLCASTSAAGTNATAASPAGSTNATLPSAFPTHSANGTLSMALPSPTGYYFSTGAKTAIKTEMLAAILWVSVGAGFFILA